MPMSKAAKLMERILVQSCHCDMVTKAPETLLRENKSEHELISAYSIGPTLSDSLGR